MSESILTSVKKGINGLLAADTSFDPEIIMFINSELAKLTQYGVGPKTGFAITGVTQTWADFAGEDNRLNFIQEFVTLSVKLVFDPPTIGGVLEAMKAKVAELEWRISTQIESKLE